ncbi:hypothetical protein Scep_000866 [Stephania cephalantha]|uniref:Fibronectin type-III domain-containing protein n=1 Tax=Stephania cephalantha TaxID=152367 RepID=A0AAP0L9L7_9MAGN
MANPGERSSGHESAGLVIDPAMCRQLSLEEKREAVRKIARSAPEVLCSWTRRDLVEVIGAEMGKQIKYTGLTKLKLVDRLLNLISEKDNELVDSSSKRQKMGDGGPLQSQSHPGYVRRIGSDEEQQNVLLCQNVACGAPLASQDKFCRRCVCCICYHYDENKDPSLWLTCGSSLPTEPDACGNSCHLKCAFLDGRSGLAKYGCCTKLDGSFRCVSCGKNTSLMRSWREQLLIAREAKELHVLCLRLYFSFAMLKGTEVYKEQHRFVDLAAKKLRREVGPLDRVTPNTGHGLVNMLSCRAVVQKHCNAALESFYSMTVSRTLSCSIRFEEASPVSVVVLLEYNANLLQSFLGCKIWHRRATESDYPEEPTYIVLRPERRFPLSNLDPSTEYIFKVSVFSITKELGSWEANFFTSAPNVEGNSLRNSTNLCENALPRDANHSRHQSLEEIYTNDELGNVSSPLLDVVPLAVSLPLPSLMGTSQERCESPDKKRQSDCNYEHCLRVIEKLERDGYMENNFHVKFSSWFSLRSSLEERWAVNAFVDTLIDDPPTLVAQLIDTFADVIYKS